MHQGVDPREYTIPSLDFSSERARHGQQNFGFEQTVPAQLKAFGAMAADLISTCFPGSPCHVRDGLGVAGSA
jgi:hypothetical protein